MNKIIVPEKCRTCGAMFCGCADDDQERLQKEKASFIEKWSAVEIPKWLPQDKSIFTAEPADWCNQINLKALDWLITRAAEGIMPVKELDAWYRVYREQVIMELNYTDLLADRIRKLGGRASLSKQHKLYGI